MIMIKNVIALFMLMFITFMLGVCAFSIHCVLGILFYGVLAGITLYESYEVYTASEADNNNTENKSTETKDE